MLEHRGEVAFQIMLEDKYVEEVGIAARAEQIPGQRDYAKGADRDRMREPERRAEVRGGEGPDADGACGENHCCGAFGQNREAEKCAEEGESADGEFFDQRSKEHGTRQRGGDNLRRRPWPGRSKR